MSSSIKELKIAYELHVRRTEKSKLDHLEYIDSSNNERYIFRGIISPKYQALAIYEQYEIAVKLGLDL